MILIAIVTLGFLIGILKLYLATSSPQVAVTTTSMTPTYGGYIMLSGEIRPFEGDMLIIKQKPPMLGDTIVFKTKNPDSIPVVHRIINITSDETGKRFFLTKGDSERNQQSDYSSPNIGWISEDNVFGVVIHRIPSIGWLSLAIQGPSMRMFLILCLLGMFGLMIQEDSDKKGEGHHQGKSRQSNTVDGKIGKLTVDIGNKSSFWRTVTNRMSKLKGKKTPIHVFIFNSQTGNLLIIGLLLVLGMSINSVIITPFQNGGNLVELLDSDGDTWNESTIASSVESITGANGSNTVLYLIPAKLRMSSSGIFNWIEKVELRLDSIDTAPIYIWTIPYSPDHQIVIRIVVPIPTVFTNASSTNLFSLRFTVKSSGLLSQEPNDLLYQLRFNT